MGRIRLTPAFTIARGLQPGENIRFLRIIPEHQRLTSASCAEPPPAILDLRAIHITVDLIRLAARPAAIVLNAVPPCGGLADEASSAVAQYQLPVAPVRISQRAAYMHSLTLGQTAQEYEPDGKAAEEMTRLYKWTCKQVGL